MQKPLCLRLEDAKAEIAAVINRHKTENELPYYLLEPILKDIYIQVANGKEAEVEFVRSNYEKNNAESEVGGNGL
jgi:hypothetical protein